MLSLCRLLENVEKTESQLGVIQLLGVLPGAVPLHGGVCV